MNQKEFKSEKVLAPGVGSKPEILWLSSQNGKTEVYSTVANFKSKGLKSLCLGIDCGEFCSDNGVEWYDWLVVELGKHFDLKLCFDNFSRSSGKVSSHQCGLGEIVEHFIFKHGKYFSVIELWRNPSSKVKPESTENIFSEDVVFAATWAKYWGKNVVLRTSKNTDSNWLAQITASQVFGGVEWEDQPESLGGPIYKTDELRNTLSLVAAYYPSHNGPAETTV